jgi:uncharacterized membrane protein
VTWHARIIADEPGRVISWKSLTGSDVDAASSVHFTAVPGQDSTKVRVQLKYDPPAGKVGSAVARLFGEHPEQQLRDDLERFREVIEQAPQSS